MKRAIVILGVLAGRGAGAEPYPCEVTIAHAPDEVRDAIEQWLVGEHCTVPLEVRVVPTEGGLYLLARDGHGRTRERIVPDAQAAGVLVASWAADDGMGRQPRVTTIEIPEESPPPTVRPLARLDDVDRGAEVAPRPRGNTWIELAMLKGEGEGARLAVDLVQRGRWTLGAAGGVSTSWISTGGAPQVLVDGSLSYVPDLRTVDARAVGYLAGTFGGGPWTLRLSLGAGFAYTKMTYDIWTDNGWAMDPVTTGGTYPVGELGALVGRDLGASWGLDVGLLASRYAETFRIPQHIGSQPLTDQMSVETDISRTSATWELIAAVRHRL
jgi:hypothetical protein